MSSGLASAVQFAGSLSGSILLTLGQAVVVVCACSDMVRLLSVPRSHRRYLANTVFRTLAPPAILATAVRALLDAATGVWPNVTAGMFVLMVLIYRWRTDTDEDSWWKGKGKALGRWFSKRSAFGLRPAPAAAMQAGLPPGKLAPQYPSVVEESRQVLRRERTARECIALHHVGEQL
ncbi:hypothetical protein QFZ23_004525 [Arthrobacter globiformis]|uniref:hypothetical protein n=1 Tax=Arthrobacter globiformis TaxID=1665 RepID=UPI0027861013|nr:hypothetical protein [Arthrobacter globiformis]MDQ1060624.1 hypothetical protein [Arthrobacter globiformis]